MTGAMRCAAAATIVLLSVPAHAQAPDAELAKGIEQVQSGSLDDAVATLDKVARRLAGTAARNADSAQAYLWLGIAYAQLDSEKSGRASFREALRLDPRVSLAGGWPPKVRGLFDAVRSEALSASAAAAAPAVTASASGETAVLEKAAGLAKAGRAAEAEALYHDWFRRNPRSVRACLGLAETILFPIAIQSPRFDEGMAVFESCLPLDQSNTPADSRQVVANLYWDKIHKGPTLTDAQKERYADRGLIHEDHALKIKPNLLDAVVYKGMFLRTKASIAKDPGKREALLEEATRLQERARELRESGKGELSAAYVPSGPPTTLPRYPTPGFTAEMPRLAPGTPPPPPPPPNAVRVGGPIKMPHKLKNANPVYSEIAQWARVQGVVILEIVISPEGKVVQAKVLRSIPLLDAAALDAVRQWEYTPTLLNGVPVPVILTATVNFTLP